MFCDELKIKVIAGKGGDGCSSFRREKFIAKGGPDGGDGGKGGDLILKTNHNINTLYHLKGKTVYRADNGENGMRKKMYGKTGRDLIIEVPPGTIVFNHDKTKQIADLDKPNQKLIIAKGGKGGLGNVHFKTSIRQAPRFAETGEPGEEKEILLELKMVADVGIIGLPSAGKSTLISVISNAKPKIAAYHFTTLIPNLGVVSMEKFGGKGTENFLVADIPGLIEGASKGKGLGHQFLKHISRTKILVHLIDGSLENIDNNYKTINKELKNFSKELAKKEQIIVINKTDIISKEELKNQTKKLKKAVTKIKIFTISAIAKQNLKELLFEILNKLQKIKKKEMEEKPQKSIREIPIIISTMLEEKFTIEKITKEKIEEHDQDFQNILTKSTKSRKIFHLKGLRLEQISIMTDTKNSEGLERMYYYFEKSGIQKTIEKQGAQLGDIIQIKEKRIPYRP